MALACDDAATAPVQAGPAGPTLWRGLTLRRATSVDLPAVCDLLCAAYGERRYRHDDLRRYLSVQEAMLWLAMVRGRPIGVAGAVRYGAVARIGMVGVHPIAQGAGVARTLVAHLLCEMDSAGCAHVTLDATPAAISLYIGLGFARAGSTARFVRVAAPRGTTAAPEVNISVMEGDDVPDVARFDAPLFGTARPSALHAFVAAYRRRAFVARDDAGRLSGYLIAQHRGLGPWVARTPAAASALLAAALSLPFDAPPSVVLPAENASGIALLERHGFRFERANAFMWRGGTPPGCRAAIYAQASFALG